MKESLSLFAALALATAASPLIAQDQPPAPAAPAERPAEALQVLPDQVVLTVDGTPITQSDVQERFMSRYSRQFQQMPPEQQAQVGPQIQRMIVSELVQKALLLNQANREKLTASDEKVAETMQEISDALPEGGTIEEYAKTAGMTVEGIRKMVVDDLKIEQLLDNVTKDLEAPTADETRKFYDENPTNFDKPESVKARHILIKTDDITDEAQLAAKKAEAEKIRVELIEKKGENFAEVAKAKSEGPSGPNGGDLGEFGRGQMVPEFEKAAFSQEVGAVGELVKTNFGYHIIMVDEKNEATKVAYADVQEKIAEGMLNERRNKKIGEYLQDLQSKADIKQPGLEPPAGGAAPGPGSPDAPPAPAPE